MSEEKGKHEIFQSLRISSDPIRQPSLDTSLDSEDFNNSIIDLPHLNSVITSNRSLIAKLQNQSYQNALTIADLQRERKTINSAQQKIRYKQYKSELNTALKLSMQQVKNPEYTYEELLLLGERIGNVNVGLAEEIIEGIPVKSLEVEEMCSICLNMGDFGKVLACGHFFHVECIDQWLRAKRSCPLCLSELV